MKLIARDQINAEKWNSLVATHSKNIHSYSWWLDEISETWCVFSDDDYTCGIALPFNRKAWIKTLHVPIFSEYPEWLGSVANQFLLSDVIQTNFECVECGFENLELRFNTTYFPSQRLSEINYSKMAVRNIKKARDHGYSLKWEADFESVYQIIEKELKWKTESMNPHNFKKLQTALQKALIFDFVKVLALYKDHKLCGGLILIETQEQVYYVKGAVDPDAKSKGGMYLAMEEAILSTLKNKKVFDFGGSKVEGVRNFNLQFGGKDIYRPYYSINHAPFWFNLLKRFKKMI